ncbi:MAG TPA: BglII/BstYI family type II restriction endonuclease [Ohtaekwangia sp.]|uniref:BglII/BstYI family type II restriction endonuclease n=1 Tax=Ohtaekwangia sp. TaxID=2066019 RepID=UPI002F93EA25
MRFEIHDHRDASSIIPKSFQEEILNTISSSNPNEPISTQKIRRAVLSKLHDCGWSDGVRINPKNSKIDITSMRADTGLCFQTGNMSRLYADILKLQTLFAEGKITASVCIVPKKGFAKKLGDNLVNYERFKKELAIFFKTVTVPILLYGIEE